jgi:hypothetical protein
LDTWLFATNSFKIELCSAMCFAKRSSRMLKYHGVEDRVFPDSRLKLEAN